MTTNWCPRDVDNSALVVLPAFELRALYTANTPWSAFNKYIGLVGMVTENESLLLDLD